MEGFCLTPSNLHGILLFRMEFGKKVRMLRKEHGLSLEQLATRSRIALATLSRIENGKGSGNFRTHQRIAEALGIQLTEMYRNLEEPEQEAVFIEPEAEEAEIFTYDEKASAILLTKQVSSKQMLPQLIVLQPGGKTSLEQYRKGTERWLFGLEGSVDVVVANKSYRLSQGGTLYFKASLPHQLQNGSAATGKVISVTSPVVL